MNLGDIAQVLGIATVGGLGTAEEQRQRADKAAALAQAAQLRREDVGFREKQLAETVRQHNAQNELYDFTPLVNQILEPLGQPPKPLGTFRYPKWAGQQAFNAIERAAALASEPQIDVNPTDLSIVGVSPRNAPPRMLPGTPAVLGPEALVGGPDTAGATATSVLSPAVPARPAARYTSPLLEQLRKGREGQQEVATETEKRTALDQAAALFSQGASMEEAHRQSGASKLGLHVKDWLGYEPAAPEKPEKPKDIVDPRTGEITRINPDGTWETLKAGTPDEGRALDVEYKRLRNEKALLDKNMADLINALRTGKPVDFKQARLAQGQYTTTGQKLILAADALPSDHPDKVSIVESGTQSLKTAAEIGRLMESRGRAPAAPGETEEQRKARLKKDLGIR